MRPTVKSLESKLEDSLQKVDARMAELNTQITRVNSDLRCDLQFNVYDRLDTLSLKIDTLRKEMAERFDAVNDRFEQNETRMDRLEQRMDRLEQRMELLELRMERLEARFDRFEAEFYPRIGEVIRDALSAIGFTYDPKLANFDQRITSLEWSRKCSRPAVFYSSSRFELMH